MPKVNIDLPAPDFSLDDFNGKNVTLSALTQESKVMLVFNRGFV